MRVLIVYPKMYLYGGAELLIVRLANYLTSKKIQNALLTTMILPEIENDLVGTQIITYPNRTARNGPESLNPLKTLWLLHKGVREHSKQFDVINVHNYPSEFSVFPFQKPVIWMCNEPLEVGINIRLHNMPLYSPKRLFYRGFLAFDRYAVRHSIKNVVVADEFNEERFVRIYGFRPHIINYGIDYHYFAAPVSKRSDGPFTMLHVGMLTPLKNQMESIRTLAQLKDTIPYIKLILAGQGQSQYLESLKTVIHNKQLADRVVITGHVSREQIRKLYHTCDVLLHPIKPQGGWLSPFEALCARLPVVVSPEMTASNIIKKENLGIVSADFPTAVLDIYKNSAKHNKMATWRAEWVRDNLSWDNFGEKMLQIFYKALNDNIL